MTRGWIRLALGLRGESVGLFLGNLEVTWSVAKTQIRTTLLPNIVGVGFSPSARLNSST